MRSWREHVARLCVFGCAALGWTMASASPITGSFEGRAINVSAPDWSVQNGDPVSGSFYLDTSVPFVRTDWPGYVQFSSNYALAGVYSFRVSFATPVGVFALDSVGLDINMYDDGRLWINGNGLGSCCAASLDLRAAPGALFDSFDPTSIHAGPFDLAASVVSYATRMYPSFDVQLDRFSFDGVSIVPEPASPWLLAGGVAAWGLSRRRAAPPATAALLTC